MTDLAILHELRELAEEVFDVNPGDVRLSLSAEELAIHSRPTGERVSISRSESNPIQALALKLHRLQLAAESKMHMRHLAEKEASAKRTARFEELSNPWRPPTPRKPSTSLPDERVTSPNDGWPEFDAMLPEEKQRAILTDPRTGKVP